MNRLKVLVFDDTAKHRESAVLTLGKNHDLTVVGTYDDAQKALTPQTDNSRRDKIFLDKYGDNDPYKSEGLDPAVRQERMDFYSKEALKQATTYPDFDVVLTDLLVPASGQAQGGEGLAFVGQEMPLGPIIALLALSAGIKNVVVATDKNHHHHPASAAFDCFGDCKLPGINILCTSSYRSTPIDAETGEAVEWSFLNSEAGKEKYPYPAGQTWGDRSGLRFGGKNWGLMLKELLEGPLIED